MYLSKQWRESRIISGLAVLGLVLLLALLVRVGFAAGHLSIGFAGGDHHRGGFGMLFVSLFYFEAVLIAFWGWLIAGIGAGKNLGEESGSFLFTRPRRRAWFLWSDWGYAMTQIALIIVLANLMIGFLLRLMHSPGTIQLADHAEPVSLFAIMALVSVGAILFAGLIYGLTYFSTIVIKRSIGVVLGAGILLAYVILSGLVHHYYPSVQLPSLIPNLFNLDHHSFYGLANHLGGSLLIRAAVMMAFPIAAQLILDRSEI